MLVNNKPVTDVEFKHFFLCDHNINEQRTIFIVYGTKINVRIAYKKRPTSAEIPWINIILDNFVICCQVIVQK